ncbi:transcription elongation factor Spt5 [Archaeoglobus sp.]
MMGKFFAVKTTVNQERIVANLMELAVKKYNLDVYSILAPKELRGYVLVEAKDIQNVKRAITGIPHARGILSGEIPFKEVEHFLTPKRAVEQIKEGYKVEIIAGPFKGEQAIVRRVDPSKNEITVELVEAVVPIPITVKADHVRVIERGE